MLNNSRLINTLLEFRSPDEFYLLHILRRKKDNPEMEKNVSIVSSMEIRTPMDLEERMPKIIKMCEAFNARAYIRLNRRSYKRTAMECLKKGVELISTEQYHAFDTLFVSCAGTYHSEPNKKWVVDIDTHDEEYIAFAAHNIHTIWRDANRDQVMPYWAQIQTKNGVHLITPPFNLKTFRDIGYQEDVHKDHMTLLYANV